MRHFVNAVAAAGARQHLAHRLVPASGIVGETHDAAQVGAVAAQGAVRLPIRHEHHLVDDIGDHQLVVHRIGGAITDPRQRFLQASFVVGEAGRREAVHKRVRGRDLRRLHHAVHYQIERLRTRRSTGDGVAEVVDMNPHVRCTANLETFDDVVDAILEGLQAGGAARTRSRSTNRAAERGTHAARSIQYQNYVGFLADQRAAADIANQKIARAATRDLTRRGTRRIDLVRHALSGLIVGVLTHHQRRCFDVDTQIATGGVAITIGQRKADIFRGGRRETGGRRIGIRAVIHIHHDTAAVERADRPLIRHRIKRAVGAGRAGCGIRHLVIHIGFTIHADNLHPALVGTKTRTGANQTAANGQRRIR